MSSNEMVNMTSKLEKKQNRFFKLDFFFKETLQLFSAKLHLGQIQRTFTEYRVFIEKSLWQLRVSIHGALWAQTKLGSIILTLFTVHKPNVQDDKVIDITSYSVKRASFSLHSLKI